MEDWNLNDSNEKFELDFITQFLGTSIAMPLGKPFLLKKKIKEKNKMGKLDNGILCMHFGFSVHFLLSRSIWIKSTIYLKLISFFFLKKTFNRPFPVLIKRWRAIEFHSICPIYWHLCAVNPVKAEKETHCFRIDNIAKLAMHTYFHFDAF